MADNALESRRPFFVVVDGRVRHLTRDGEGFAQAFDEVYEPIDLDREHRSRFLTLWSELERRMETETAVFEMTYAWTFPGMEYPLVFEVEGMAPPPGSAPSFRVQTNMVDVDHPPRTALS